METIEFEPNDQTTFAIAEKELSNGIYFHSNLFEQLEHLGKYRGNGHHARQKLAEFATQLLKENWAEKSA